MPQFELFADVSTQVTIDGHSQIVIQRYVNSIVRFMRSLYTLKLEGVVLGFFELSSCFEFFHYRNEIVNIATCGSFMLLLNNPLGIRE